jgi:hypothetical protein
MDLQEACVEAAFGALQSFAGLGSLGGLVHAQDTVYIDAAFAVLWLANVSLGTINVRNGSTFLGISFLPALGLRTAST